MSVRYTPIVWLLAVFLALTGCDHDLTGPEMLETYEIAPLTGWVVYGPEKVDPPPMWREQYEAVDSIIPKAGDLGRVRWLVADSILERRGPRSAAGLWVYPHSIVISDAFVRAPGILCHESVHEITQSSDHSLPWFDECVNDGVLNGIQTTEVPGGAVLIVSQHDL